VLIYVPLDSQVSRLSIDSAKIAGLFYAEGRSNALSDEGVYHDANIDVFGRVPIGPLCGRLLYEIDVLALRVLLCAEESHCRSPGMCKECLRLNGLYVGILSVPYSHQPIPIDIRRF
jgi:hypothetical protein